MSGDGGALGGLEGRQHVLVEVDGELQGLVLLDFHC